MVPIERIASFQFNEFCEARQRKPKMNEQELQSFTLSTTRSEIKVIKNALQRPPPSRPVRSLPSSSILPG